MNGSFELDSIGENITGMYWKSELSPDIDNGLDQFPNVGNSSVMWSDSVLRSNDGGNWQNLSGFVTLNGVATLESIGQQVELQLSTPHELIFEFTAQNTKPSFPGLGYAAIDVFIDGELEYTTNVDSTLFTWEKVNFIFTPKKRTIFIQFKINPVLAFEPGKEKYIAIDGVCLRPISMGVFCDP